MAKTMLREDDVLHINKQCDLFVGTNLAVPKALKVKSIGEKGGEQHATEAKANKHNLHRRKSRRALKVAKQEGLTMYADSHYRRDDAPQRYRLPVIEEMPRKLQQLADHFNKR